MRLSSIGSLIVSALVLTACLPGDEIAGFRGDDPYDRPQNLERDDYRKLNDIGTLLPEGATGDVQTGAPPIPDVAQILAAPRPPKIGQSKLVSISVTEDVPLRDVLFELSRLADVDIEVGNGIEGGINFRAKNKPFNEVVERISSLGGLRYKMTNGVLRIEPDTSYIKNYSVDFLNLVRSSESSVSISTDVLSAGSEEGGESSGGSSSSSSSSSSSGGSSAISSGTSASINSTAESDLWSSLEASIQEILSSTATNTTRTSTQEASISATTATSGAAEEGGYVINRQAGIISVNGTERQHDAVQRFLTLMERNASAQVLIEAKIVEVTLLDEFRSGINWDSVVGRGRFGLNFQSISDITTNNVMSFTLDEGTGGGDINDLVRLIQRFGTTRTMSSPRLHAINNQPAVLTVAQNRIFFEVQVTGGSSTSGGGTVTTTQPSFNTTRRSIPIGIIMTILPSVNLKTNEVTLNVRPTLSRVVNTVQDPGTVLAAQLAGATISNDIPIVEVRELDSIMKVKSGGVMVIGGLMEDTNTGQQDGVPGASEIPWIGNAFKSRNETTRKRELIVFIKATILNSAGSHQAADKAIYEKFNTDPRPLKLQ
ncbi:MAG: secretin N-terminal domain-containing protein [Alphaproteobacteria bacterium]|nr:secretin N-terminal domain-containing protein [Alphaproteobacteria bacterium]